MAGDSKQAWTEVGEHFSDLGHRLAERYRALGDDGADGAAGAEESRRKVEEAVRAVTQQLDRTFTSIGDTMRDPEAKQSLDRAVASLGSALSSTFAEAGTELRRRFGQRPEPADAQAPDDEPSPKGDEHA